MVKIKDRHYKYQDLADMIGVTKQCFYHKRRHDKLSFGELDKIAGICGTTIEDLGFRLGLK